MNPNGNAKPFATLTTLLGNGKGAFQTLAPVRFSSLIFATADAVGDVNSDGVPDLVIGGLPSVNNDGSNAVSKPCCHARERRRDVPADQFNYGKRRRPDAAPGDMRGAYKVDIVENWFNVVGTQTAVGGSISALETAMPVSSRRSRSRCPMRT